MCNVPRTISLSLLIWSVTQMNEGTIRKVKLRAESGKSKKSDEYRA